MDDDLMEAKRQIDTYLPPPTAPAPATYVPPPQRTQAPPTVVAPSASGSGIWLWVITGFVFVLLTYLAVTYARDVRNRETHNKRYNLDAYIAYATSLSNRLPKGHVVGNVPAKYEPTLEPPKAPKTPPRVHEIQRRAPRLFKADP